VIGNSTYQVVLPSLDTPVADAMAIQNYLIAEAGFNHQDVILLVNKSASEVTQHLDAFKTLVRTMAAIRSCRGLVFIYYSGHGCYKGPHLLGYASDGSVFHLEESTRWISTRPNHFAVAFFDCCREPIHPSLDITGKGAGELETKQADDKVLGQLHLIFAVPPGKKSCNYPGK